MQVLKRVDIVIVAIEHIDKQEGVGEHIYIFIFAGDTAVNQQLTEPGILVGVC